MKILFFLSLVLSAGFAHAMSLTEYLAQPANPLKISIVLDREKVSQKVEAKTGGMIVLRTTSGDTFELMIPPKALMADTTITLQKIKSVKHSKLPSTAQFSGVEIFPDGTQLLKTATLTIKTKNEFPLTTLTPFSAMGSGDETHFAMLISKPVLKEIKLGLQHFSNYSVTSDPTFEEIVAQGFTRSELTRISNWLAHKLLQAEKNGGDPVSVLKEAFQEAFDKAVLPSISRITNCQTGKDGLENYLMWERAVSLRGLDPQDFFPDGFKTSLQELIHKVVDECMKEAKRACYVEHNPLQASNYTLTLEKFVQNMGMTELGDEIADFRDKCLTFKFFMESEIWVGDTRDESHSITAKSEFTFTMVPHEDDFVQGNVEVVSVDLTAPDMECKQVSFKAEPTTLMIKNFFKGTKEEDTKIPVSIGTMMPNSYAKFECVDGSDKYEVEIPPGGAGSYWGGLFFGAHGPTGTNEFDMKTGSFIFKDWDLRHDVRFLSKEYTQTVQDTIHETTTMVIYHMPKPL